MKIKGTNKNLIKGEELLAQVLGLKPGSNADRQEISEAEREKMLVALARLAEQNPDLLTEIIQKWLVKENKPVTKPDLFN
jgi:flagellar biosynthesis/type III secretory pathway M-ring protein FliF/YscJ